MTEGKRRTSLLNDVLEHRMALYALAVAGASLVSGSASQAQIVFTPSHVTLNRYDTLQIDLNNDGNIDFTLHNGAGTFSFRCSAGRGRAPDSSTCRSFRSYLYAIPAQKPSRAAIIGGSLQAASALQEGARIDGRDEFLEEGELGALVRGFEYGVSGNFVNVTDRFLGVRFQINGQTHYGWIGFRSVTHGTTIQAVLGGWAYETQANTPIRAGDTGREEDNSAALIMREPTALELLAMGHTAVAERQRRMMVA